MRRRRGHVSNLAAGLIAVTLVAVGTFFAFYGEVPFRGHYEINASMKNSGQLIPGSPVRIAGVTAGKVTGVGPGGPGRTVVRMRIDQAGRPIHTDAKVKIKIRTALEGNEFVDLEPGSPSAPELADGGTIPTRNTASAVQLDEVLGTLTKDTRGQLLVLLDQYGRGLSGKGARGINRSTRYWKDAYRDGALMNTALLGPRLHDLSSYLGDAGTVAGAVDAHPENLKLLLDRFDQTAGALAAERGSLGQTVRELPGTLRVANRSLSDVNALLPDLDRLTTELRPAAREAAPTIDQTRPLLRQLRLLAQPSELQGVARDLRPTIRSSAALTRGLVPLLKQVRAASSCQDRVILPWARSRIDDPAFPKHGAVYQEAVQGVLPGLAGESRSGDANGQWFTPVALAGSNVAEVKAGTFSTSGLPVTGVNPRQPQQRPPIRPDVSCETQPVPDLRSVVGASPPQFQAGVQGTAAEERWAKARLRAIDWTRSLLKGQGLQDLLKVSDQDLKPSQLLERGGRP